MAKEQHEIEERDIRTGEETLLIFNHNYNNYNNVVVVMCYILLFFTSIFALLFFTLDILVGGLFTIFPLIFVYFIYSSKRHKNDYIAVTNKGISWEYAKRKRFIFWNDVVSCDITYKLNGSNIKEYFSIKASDGTKQKFKLNEYNRENCDTQQLCEVINAAYKEYNKNILRRDIQNTEELIDYKKIERKYKKKDLISWIITITLIIIYCLLKYYSESIEE